MHKVRHGVEDDDELYCEEWVKGKRRYMNRRRRGWRRLENGVTNTWLI